MKAKEIKNLVDNAVALHREIAAKSEQLKRLKAHLVQQARLNPESLVPTESGGTRWTAEGGDGCVARVSFPAAGIVAEIEPDDAPTKMMQAIAGDKFRRLFKAVRIFQPVEDFRSKVGAILPAQKAQALLELCETESAPRVSFEAAKPVENATTE